MSRKVSGCDGRPEIWKRDLRNVIKFIDVDCIGRTLNKRVLMNPLERSLAEGRGMPFA